MYLLMVVSLCLLSPPRNTLLKVHGYSSSSQSISFASNRKTWQQTKDRNNSLRLFAEPPSTSSSSSSSTPTKNSSKPKKQNQDIERNTFLSEQTFGGYTVKQRLREEVESPFRKVRLLFFGSSALSALIALYFSTLAAIKANIGGYTDAIPLDEALNSCAVNIAGVVVCSVLTFRDYKAGQSNLERIARGGMLAKLAVSAAGNMNIIRTLSDYRRSNRVLICAGGKEYIDEVCLSLNSDQLKDENNLPELIQQVDLLVVPVLLTDNSSDAKLTVGNTKDAWQSTVPSTTDRNFDSTKSDSIVAYPWNSRAWTDYLTSEIETAKNQGFDVLSKGITIIVKKNGKILRRATGSPKWADLIETMEVLDGSRFGMPGDSAKYGGP